MGSRESAQEQDAPTAESTGVVITSTDVNVAAALGMRWVPVIAQILFLLLWNGSISNARDDESAFALGELTRERLTRAPLLPTEAEVETTFYNVSTLDEAAKFMRGPMLEAIFGEQSSRASGPFEVGWVSMQSKLVGAVRVRQIRAATNSCHVSDSVLRTLQRSCYPSLSGGSRLVAPLYGENLGGGMRRVYRYSAAASDRSAWSRFAPEVPIVALVHGYLPGGYIVDLPARKLHAAEVLDQMTRDRFLSVQETRAVVIDYSLYNANVNTFCVVRLTFEHLHSGAVKPHASVTSARLLPYDGEGGQEQRVLESLMTTYVVIVFLLRLRSIRVARLLDGDDFSWRRHLLQPKILVDWLLIALYYAMRAQTGQIETSMEVLAAMQAEPGAFDPNTHVPLYDVAAIANLVSNFAAIISLIGFAKLFLCLPAMPIVDRLRSTLRSALSHILIFLGTFLFAMLGFAVAFQLAFGTRVRSFHALSVSFISLVRCLLGDLDLKPLLQANYHLAIGLSISFFISVRIIICGLAVAIVLAHFGRQPPDGHALVELAARLAAGSGRLARLSHSQRKTLITSASGAIRESVQQSTRSLAPSPQRATEGGESDKAATRKEIGEWGRRGLLQNRTRAVAFESTGEGATLGPSGSSSGGWIPSGEHEEGEEAEEDPLRDAEIAFRIASEDSAERAMAETRVAVARLKEVYIALSDVQQARSESMQEAALAIRALRDENFAIASALRGKGVFLRDDLDVLDFIPQRVSDPFHSFLKAAPVDDRSVVEEEKEAGSSPRSMRAQESAETMQHAEDTLEQVRRAVQGDGPPPPGVAGAAAHLSLVRSHTAKSGAHVMDQAGWAANGSESSQIRI